MHLYNRRIINCKRIHVRDDDEDCCFAVERCQYRWDNLKDLFFMIFYIPYCIFYERQLQM